MKRSTFVRSGIALAITATAVPHRILAQEPEASPAASPAAAGEIPSGPLGEQALWLLEVANAGPGQVTAVAILEHFSESFLAETPMSEIFTTLSEFPVAGVTYEIEPGSFISTRDFPASNGSFVLLGSDGSRTEVGLQIEPDTGLISALTIQPATDGATPEASPVS